jgi:hypothetical protein
MGGLGAKAERRLAGDDAARNPAARIPPSETACATMRPAPRMKIMPAKNSRADGPGRPTHRNLDQRR